MRRRGVVRGAAPAPCCRVRRRTRPGRPAPALQLLGDGLHARSDRASEVSERARQAAWSWPDQRSARRGGRREDGPRLQARFYTDSSTLRLFEDRQEGYAGVREAGEDRLEGVGHGRRHQGVGREPHLRSARHEAGRFAVFGDAEVRYNADRPTVGHPRVNHACRRRWQQPHLQQHRAIVD